tara:strand:- start:339 stop:695 length:357 start_codon:yes stop_codon:yes gene_type:complete
MSIDIVRTDGKTDEERLQAGLEICRIPEHMHDGVKAYVLKGRPCGDFLALIIQNDFYTAAKHADNDNRSKLFEYADLLYNHFPHEAHGSVKNYGAWIKMHRENREAKKASEDRKSDAG